MFKKKDINYYMVSTIILAFLFIVLLGFILSEKYAESQAGKLQNTYVAGYNKGVEDSVVSIYQQTNNCQVVPVNIGNVTRGLADVDCIKKVLEEQSKQG